jgi:sugar lactone lactonase YvrE
MKYSPLLVFLFSFFFTPHSQTQSDLYFTSKYGGIQKVNQDGSQLEKIRTNLLGIPRTLILDSLNQKLYWADQGHNQIMSADLDGANIQTIIAPEWESSIVSLITFDPLSQVFYWIDTRKKNINKTSLENPKVEPILPYGGNAPTDIKVDAVNKKLYWVNRNLLSIQRCELDGTDIKTVVSQLKAPFGMQLDVENGKVLWAEKADGQIEMINTDGTGRDTLVTSLGPVERFLVDFDKENVYFAGECNGLNKIQFDGGSPEQLIITDILGRNCYFGLALTPSGESIFWSDRLSRTIGKINIDGTGFQELISPVIENPEAIAIDTLHQKMYWTQRDFTLDIGFIYRANLDGTDVETLSVSQPSFPRGIALDLKNEKMYWTDRGRSAVYRADLDGANRELITFSPDIQPEGIALDIANEKIYFTVQGSGKIYRINYDKSGLERIIRFSDSPGFAHNIALDLESKKMYWLGSRNGIQRMNLDGTEIEDLVKGTFECRAGIALNLNNKKIFWKNEQTILSANLDGSEVDTVATQLARCTGVGYYMTSNGSQAYLPFKISTATAEKDVENFSFKAFPNPVSDQLFIKVQQERYSDITLAIRDLNGRTQKIEKFYKPEMIKVDVSDLLKELYILEIRSNQIIGRKKIIKL